MTPYVLVSGDFTPWGGMDRANYELAWYVAEEVGAAVHLVSHRVALPLREHPRVAWHRVPKPIGSYILGGPWLATQGRRVARRLSVQGARVIVNGGNCAWPGVNWVHAVHAAWNCRHDGAPATFRIRAAWLKRTARRSERRAVSAAELVLTNSQRARRQIIDLVGVAPERVHTVYYGIDPEAFCPPSPEARLAARRRLGWSGMRPVVAFIGAFGYDRNKGFDILFAAWESLAHDPAWDAELVAAGAGAEIDLWRRRVAASGLRDRVRILGFTELVPEILAAADVFVSPTHYDAYGLAVQEALCVGLPAFVTKTAGIAERYPDDLQDLLLSDPPDPLDLARRLRQWRLNPRGYAERVAPFGAMLRRRTWTDMASDIVGLSAATRRTASRLRPN